MPLSDVHSYSSLTFDATSLVSGKGKCRGNEKRMGTIKPVNRNGLVTCGVSSESTQMYVHRFLMILLFGFGFATRCVHCQIRSATVQAISL